MLGAMDGTVSSVVNGGVEPYMYDWNTPDMDTTASVGGLVHRMVYLGCNR